MKKNLLLVISTFFLSFFALFAVMANAMTEQQKEGRILETLITIDKNEIDLAKVAEKKSTNPDVKNFAETMIKDHSKNLDDTEALSKKIQVEPESSNKINLLKRAGAEEAKALAQKQGNEFDSAYADAMVKGHGKALQIIEEKMIPNTSNQELLNLLNATKDTVAHHLEMAKDLQSKISKS